MRPPFVYIFPKKKKNPKQNKDNLSVLVKDRDFFVQFSQLALYHDLSTIEFAYEFVKVMDLDQCDPYFKLLVEHQILAAHREEEIQATLKPVTPIPNNQILQFYNSQTTPTWVPSNISHAIRVK